MSLVWLGPLWVELLISFSDALFVVEALIHPMAKEENVTIRRESFLPINFLALTLYSVTLYSVTLYSVTLCLLNQIIRAKERSTQSTSYISFAVDYIHCIPVTNSILRLDYIPTVSYQHSLPFPRLPEP
jgi:hypothetical protein